MCPLLELASSIGCGDSRVEAWQLVGGAAWWLSVVVIGLSLGLMYVVVGVGCGGTGVWWCGSRVCRWRCSVVGVCLDGLGVRVVLLWPACGWSCLLEPVATELYVVRD